LSSEKHAKSRLVKTLAPLADFFVLDGFSVSHRSHASVVGFGKVLTCVAGRVMEREINSIEKVFSAKGRIVFSLAGVKVEECINIMHFFLKHKPKSVEHILTSGVLSELFLIANGCDVGKWTKSYLKKKDYLKLIPTFKHLLKKYNGKIELPVDVAIEVCGKRKEVSVDDLPVEKQILDIGRKTLKNYSKIIKKAGIIVVKGPAGVYEKNKFSFGTKMLFNLAARSNAFSLVGGGDTTTAIKELGINKKRFSYVSLGGGALITYLTGKKMPGIEILKSR
jgi:phosphoglycerate kinase